MFVRIFFFAVASFCFIFSVSFAEEDPVLAKAGDYLFRKSDLDRLIAYSPEYIQKQLKGNPQQRAQLVKHLMRQKVLSDLARKEGFDKDADIKEQLRYIIDDFFSKEYLLRKVTEAVKVTDDDVQKYYKDNKEKYSIPDQVRARHILVKVPLGASPEEKKKAREKAEAMIGWLLKGEKFEKLAEAYSDDPDTKKKGGDLGYFSKGRMPKSFEDAAFFMKTGQISDAVETDYGYHIIMVEDRKEGWTKPFEEVKDGIRKQLTDELTRAKTEEIITKAAKDAGLEIYSEKITGH